jgi:hypothetical protein
MLSSLDNYVNTIKIATAMYIIKKRAASIALFLIALSILYALPSLYLNQLHTIPLAFL